MRPWKHFGARLSERLWPTAPTGRRSASAGNSLSISKPITTGAGSTALWGTNHLWNSKQQTTKIERTDSTKCVHKKGGREKIKRISKPKQPRGTRNDALWASRLEELQDS